MCKNRDLKGNFKQDVVTTLKDPIIKYKTYFKRRSFTEIKKDNWYYKGHYWFCFELKESKKDITHLLIKPYRITTADVLNAENQSIGKKVFEENGKAQKYNFENNKKSIIEFDEQTGNFHKKMKSIGKIEFQIILANKDNSAKQLGPGWTDSSFKCKSEELVLKRNVKTNWYFPPIDDKEHKETLKELLESAIKAVYDIKETEQK